MLKTTLKEMLFKKSLSILIKKYHETKIYWHPRRFYRNKNDIFIKNPIFFLGIQGGGLTLISRAIRLLPEIVYIAGNHRFWGGRDELHNNKRFKHLPDALTLRSPGYYNLLGHEKNHPDFGYERAFLYASNDFINEYRLTAADWTPELDYVLKDAIKTCLRTYADNIKAAQFLDMSQSYILKIPFLKRCFPNARFIIVTRDPFAVCWKQAQVSLIFQKDPKRAVRLAAEHWHNSYCYALKDTKNDVNTLWLCFEDFMQDPLNVLEKIFCFLNKSNIDVAKLIAQHQSPPLGSEDPEKWFPINSDVNRRHHKALPDWARNIIATECGVLLDEFGYFSS